MGSACDLECESLRTLSRSRGLGRAGLARGAVSQPAGRARDSGAALCAGVAADDRGHDAADHVALAAHLRPHDRLQARRRNAVGVGRPRLRARLARIRTARPRPGQRAAPRRRQVRLAGRARRAASGRWSWWAPARFNSAGSSIVASSAAAHPSPSSTRAGTGDGRRARHFTSASRTARSASAAAGR